jgi:hypothetical protein
LELRTVNYRVRVYVGITCSEVEGEGAGTDEGVGLR